MSQFMCGNAIMPYFVVFFLTLFFTTPGWADNHIQEYADFQAFHVEKTVQAIDLALLDSSEFVERNLSADELVLHNTLTKYVERTPGLRAIIATNEKGQLTLDSFTYPAKDISLADRSYVKAALSQTDRTLYIGSPLVGRSSGAAFVPFARPLLNANKKAIGAIAGIIHPGFLIKQDTLCPQCIVTLINERNEVLVSYPSNTDFPDTFIDRINAMEDSGMLEGTINDHQIQTWVTILDDYKIRVSISKFLNTKKK